MVKIRRQHLFALVAMPTSESAVQRRMEKRVRRKSRRALDKVETRLSEES